MLSRCHDVQMIAGPGAGPVLKYDAAQQLVACDLIISRDQDQGMTRQRPRESAAGRRRTLGTEGSIPTKL